MITSLKISNLKIVNKIFKFNKNILLILLIGLTNISLAYGAMPSKEPELKDAQVALERLMEGNQRYISGKSKCGWNTNVPDSERRQQLANTQRPFAIILGCSDSRVPPEVIFDQRLGDLFVVRVAGNVVDDVVLGSIEFAARFLEKPTPLVVVLGHERCGAIVSSIQAVETNTPVDNHIASIVRLIKPVIEKTKKVKGQDFTNDVILENIRSTVKKLKTSTPVLVEAVNNNQLKIVGAVYDLDTGKVKMVE